jgi:hypothetical protein
MPSNLSTSRVSFGGTGPKLAHRMTGCGSDQTAVAISWPPNVRCNAMHPDAIRREEERLERCACSSCDAMWLSNNLVGEHSSWRHVHIANFLVERACKAETSLDGHTFHPTKSCWMCVCPFWRSIFSCFSNCSLSLLRPIHRFRWKHCGAVPHLIPGCHVLRFSASALMRNWGRGAQVPNASPVLSRTPASSC